MCVQPSALHQVHCNEIENSLCQLINLEKKNLKKNTFKSPIKPELTTNSNN